MALTSDEATRLANLQAAYDKLISGQQVVLAMTGGLTGRRVQYGLGDIPTLKAEIEILIAKRDSRTGRTRGALRFRL